MKNIGILGLSASIMFLFTFSSCQKQEEKSIKANWKLEKINKSDTMTTRFHEQSWEFDGSKVSILYDDIVTGEVFTDVGNYIVDAGATHTYLTIDGLSAAHAAYNVKWEILKLNGDVLIFIYNPDGYWDYREFSKI